MMDWIGTVNLKTSEKNICDVFNKLRQKEAVNEEVSRAHEYIRLIKVLKYLIQAITLLPGEYAPVANVTIIKNASEALVSSANAVQIDINVINFMNLEADKITSNLIPFVKVDSKNVNAFKESYVDYQDYFSSKIKEVEDIYLKLDVFHKQGNKIHDEFSAMYESVFSGTDDEMSRLSKISEYELKAKEMSSDIVGFHSRIFETSDHEEGIKSQILNFRNEADKFVSEMKGNFTQFDDGFNDLVNYHEKIFGKKGEDGERMGGLKNEIDINKKNMKVFLDGGDIKYKALFEKIESLLPGASSAGLAEAYHSRLNSYSKPKKNFNLIFYGAIFALAVVALLPSKPFGFGGGGSLLEGLIFKLPVLAPLIWLATFASNRSNELTRLEEEYAHKEALARSYESFKKQILELGTENDHLMPALLDVSVKAIGHNASIALDKRNAESHPYKEMLDAALDKISSILPGSKP